MVVLASTYMGTAKNGFGAFSAHYHLPQCSSLPTGSFIVDGTGTFSFDHDHIVQDIVLRAPTIHWCLHIAIITILLL